MGDQQVELSRKSKSAVLDRRGITRIDGREPRAETFEFYTIRIESRFKTNDAACFHIWEPRCLSTPAELVNNIQSTKKTYAPEVLDLLRRPNIKVKRSEINN